MSSGSNLNAMLRTEMRQRRWEYNIAREALEQAWARLFEQLDEPRQLVEQALYAKWLRSDPTYATLSDWYEPWIEQLQGLYETLAKELKAEASWSGPEDPEARLDSWRHEWIAQIQEVMPLLQQELETKQPRPIPDELEKQHDEWRKAWATREFWNIAAEEFWELSEICKVLGDPRAIEIKQKFFSAAAILWEAYLESRTYREDIGLTDDLQTKLKELSILTDFPHSEPRVWGELMHEMIELFAGQRRFEKMVYGKPRTPMPSKEAIAELIASERPVVPVKRNSDDPFASGVKRVKNAHNDWENGKFKIRREVSAMVGDTGRQLKIRPRKPCLVIRDPLTREPLPPSSGTYVPDTIHWRRLMRDGYVVMAE